MSCIKGKVNIVKLHDTQFYCCDQLLKDMEESSFDIHRFTLRETVDILGIKFCPYCGSKLSKNV